jgi:hypothetical protein
MFHSPAVRMTALMCLAAAPLAAQNAPAATPTAAKLSPADEARFLALGKQYTRWFLNGFADSLSAAVAPEVLEKLGGADGIRDQMNMVAERAGSETRMLVEKMTMRNGQPQFWHEGEFSVLTSEPLVVRWIFDKDGKITGAGLGPKSQTPPPDQQ